ncbi:hypothetical protein K503DRAFT_155273 [Rhizopogon vinicolor AM-OR11-026]|uniref:Uncharacterized protein n=1 Tax=Rhizopogon vinicolor AM-OR11-026 TaxID=1314800 RepID=A0A1B7NF90_9AGAM|nr:hypothetical protein K503DRAFT_155273 [Rhizopogon vinicolor AM-OR11-026]
MQAQNDVHEVSVQQKDILAELQALRRSVRQLETQLPKTITRGCMTLVDATGCKHQIQMDHCTSYQQLNMMVSVLFQCNSKEARIQR